MKHQNGSCWENVKNLVGKKFKPYFDRWLQKLDKLGYNTYWKVLNAKDYGIPQNRERVFAISIRKDIDTGYAFPQPFELTIRLKDILEPEVDEKYYISNDRMNVLLQNIEKSKLQEDLPSVNQIGNCVKSDGKFDNPQRGRVYSMNGCSPALNCCCGVGLEPKILEPIIAASRGRNSNNTSDRTIGAPTEQRLEINQNGTSNTITTVQKDNYVVEPNVLTPKRTEYGKAIRKDYESGLIHESRHNMTEMLPRNDGVSNTLTTVQKDNYVMIPQATNQGYIECNVPGVADLSFPDSKTRRGRVQENGEICPTLMAGQQDICYIESEYNRPKLVGGIGEINFGKQYRQGNRVYDSEAIAMCLNAQPVGNAGGNSYLYKTGFRIRRLTPLECWRLMGFTDEQFYKAQAVNSNSQLYKQAGNSIVVDVLYWIFYQLFVNENKQQVIEEQDQLTGQMNIFDFIGG